LFGKFSFKGGVHPPHNKNATSGLPIETLPPPPRVVIPLSQHIGAPAQVAVKRGDPVKIGQVLGESGGFVSAPVHASVSGKVSSLGEFPHPLGRQVLAVEIENDGKDETVEFKAVGPSWRETAPGDLIKTVQSAGIVGMGGASFPTHVKLSPPGNKKIDTVIINGAECEPYLTADHRLLLEKTPEILTGAFILKKILGAQKVFIAIEDNKPDAIAAVAKLIADPQFSELQCARLRTKYPQGGEKQLINAITGRQVPSGGLPMDVGCVVQNAGTAYAVWDAVINGTPLYQRVVTVTGPCVASPKNLLVRIGTPVSALLACCGADMEKAKKVVSGGPMMGLAQSDIEAPVIKSTSGILVLDKTMPAIQANDCIRCGSCVKACPIHLVPSHIAKLVDCGKDDLAAQWDVLDCMECGSCAYVCPARINLVHFMKLGKFRLAAQKAAQKKN